MVRWRSPTVKVAITSVLSKDNDDMSGVENDHDNNNQISCTPHHIASKSTSTIDLPKAGYYGFCLEKCTRNNACACDIVISTAVSEQEQQSSITSAITTSSPSTHIQNNMTTETFCQKLPFVDKENESLTSMHVGKKLWVPATGNNSTRVTVSCTHCMSCQQSVDSTLHRKKRTSWKWCMVLVESHTAKSDEEESLSKAEQEKDKIIVCAVCGRLFNTCREVQRHIESLHASTLTHKKHQKPQQQQQHRNQNQNQKQEDISSFSSSLWTTPLEVVYQDDSLAVVNKPQGMAVMGAQHSLIKSDLLLPLAWTKENSMRGTTVPIKKNPALARPLRKPIPVHRLDSATGGLLVVAKTKETEILLKDSFSDRTCHKRYRALVCGRLLGNNKQCDTGVVEENPQTLLQNQSSTHSVVEGVCSETISGKKALTKYRIVKHCRSLQTPQQDCWVTVVDLFPITGRRHQLRRHMKALGHPIWGDRRYGYNDAKQKCQEEVLANDIHQESTTASTDIEHHKNMKLAVRKKPFSRLCLWAVEISFPHPITGEKMTVCQENEPEWLLNVVRDQEQLWAESR